MGETMLTLMEIVGPIILLGLLAWLVLRTRSKGKESSNPTTERATRELYEEEEQRRKDGVDGL